MTTQEQINNLFTLRYDYLLSVAKNILRRSNLQDLAEDLLTEALLDCNDNLDKIEQKLKNGLNLEAYVVRWLTMQNKWTNTRFKKNWVYNDNTTITEKQLQEHTNDDITIESLISNEIDDEEDILRFEKEHQDMVNHIQNYYETSNIPTKQLFELVYHKGYNTSSKLANVLKMTRTPAYMLMRALREDIVNKYKNKENND